MIALGGWVGEGTLGVESWTTGNRSPGTGGRKASHWDKPLGSIRSWWNVEGIVHSGGGLSEKQGKGRYAMWVDMLHIFRCHLGKTKREKLAGGGEFTKSEEEKEGMLSQGSTFPWRAGWPLTPSVEDGSSVSQAGGWTVGWAFLCCRPGPAQPPVHLLRRGLTAWSVRGSWGGLSRIFSMSRQDVCGASSKRWLKKWSLEVFPDSCYTDQRTQNQNREDSQSQPACLPDRVSCSLSPWSWPCLEPSPGSAGLHPGSMAHQLWPWASCQGNISRSPGL